MSAQLWTNCWWMFTCGLAFCEAVLVLSTAGQWKTTTLNSRVYGIGNLPRSLAPFIGRLWPQGRNIRLRGLWLLLLSCSGELVLVWVTQKSVRAAGSVPLFPLASKCPHTWTCMSAHPADTHEKERQSKWNSGSCLLSFLLVLPTLWAVSSKCFFMAFSGELLEWLSFGHALA